MTTTLVDRAAPSPASAAQRLRADTAAVRVSLRWLGVRKTLTPEQKTQAAESFGAEGDFLSARKKLLDTRHPAYKEVTAVRGRVLSYWKGLTLPYPEPGVRLIHQDRIEAFNQQMTELRDATSGRRRPPRPALRRAEGRGAASGWAGCTIRPTIRPRSKGCSISTGTSRPSSRPTT